MPKEKAPPKDTSGEIPPWFMTYSDVITLLMTFFILLLTFASSEPEKFERMKITAFGAGGSDGVAGKKSDSLDRESSTFRYRPEKAKLTRHGSETAPTESDISTTNSSAGMKDLEDPSGLADFQRLRFSTSKNSLLNSQGKLTALGLERVGMIARHLSKRNMRLSVTVPSTSDLGPVVQLAHDMTYTFGVPVGTVAVGVTGAEEQKAYGNRDLVHFTLIRELDSQ
ncbi:MAG: flagellar motor protein MotB [Fuerstiella sp.]